MKTDPRERIAATVRREVAREITRLSRLLNLVPSLDPEVAAKALEVFSSPQGAAEWLLCDTIPSFPGGAPLELSQSPIGKKRVLNVLNAIAHGIFL
jgi:uncharacterized protein (DUF2384 family)